MLSTIIFIITRGWHNRPGVAAVPIVLQSKKKKSHQLAYKKIGAEISVIVKGHSVYAITIWGSITFGKYNKRIYECGTKKMEANKPLGK
jgi:hypothetical protein